MSMLVTWDTTHLIMGDSATLNITWNQDFTSQPYYQPYYWLITGDVASGGVNFFNTTIPAVLGDGATTTYTWTPTTWGWIVGDGTKRSGYRIIPLDGSGNSMGMIYGPGNLIHYEMPTITVTASPSTITSSGEDVTFTWSANGNLNRVHWDRGGYPYNPQDLFVLYAGTQDQPQNGTKTITQGGGGYNGNLFTTQTFVFTASNDSPHDYYGIPPLIKARLTDSDTVTVNVAIPVYGIGTNKSSYAEGETITCAVTTTNGVPGTTVYWKIYKITSTLADGDFASSPRSGSFQLDSNGEYTWNIWSFDDSTPEGPESFTLKLHSDYARTNLLAESGTITIEASDQQAYGIGTNKNSYNEGETIYGAVTTSSIPTGTTLYYRFNGAAIDAGDFVGSDLGSGVTDANGGFTFTRQIANDLTTEQTETFYLQLFTDSSRLTQVASSSLCYINDTSVNVAYDIVPTKTSVNEGETFGYGVGVSSGLSLGTVLYWVLEGVGITANDFIPASLSGSATVVDLGGGNRGFSVGKTLRADQTTEGGELLYFRICTDAALTNIVATNTQVYLNDTSTNPPPTISFSASPTTINSGGTSRLTWQVTNVNTGGNAVSINQGVGSVPNSSYRDVNPTVNTTYTLTAIGPGGTNTATATVNITQPPTISATGPSTVDWQTASIPIQVTATNSPGISLIETYDGVAKAPVSLPNSSGTVNWNPYNYTPDWSSPVGIIQLQFTCGTVSAFVVISVDVDITPDAINIPSSTGLPEEEHISPPISVEVKDIDIPVEITANKPIKVEIDDSGTWQPVKQTGSN